MKRISIIVITLVMALSLFLPTVAHASDDIKGHYFEGEMRFLINQGILGGYGSGTYLPNKHVTRAEFTTFLVRTLKLFGTDSATTFTDVKKGEWYYHDISVATHHGIIGGYGDKSFRPNQKITREQMAAITLRALNSKGVTSIESSKKFADEKSINPIFLPSAKQLQFLGIIGGKSRNGKLSFVPKDYTTRAETAAILTRTLNVLSDPKVIIGHTPYDYNFKHMLDRQVAGTPKVDGGGVYTASSSLVEYYVNPNNFSKDSREFMQFLILSQTSGVTAKEINDKFLNGRGILDGQGQAFIEAGRKHKINEVYLIAHALHETGNGTSTLARGIEVGRDKNGKSVIVTSSNRASLKNIKKTYNMYGVRAYDNCASECGSEYAYDQGWFTPADAIIGGAEFIFSYIKRGQDTLYKMKWNPVNPGYPQYATHVQWATLQAERIQLMYDKLDTYSLKFDVPKFNDKPAPTKLPTGVAQYHVNTKLANEKGFTNSNDPLNFRTGPTTAFSVISQLTKGTEVVIQGENGGWYKIKIGNKTGWVSSRYVDLAKNVKSASLPAPETDEHDSEAPAGTIEEDIELNEEQTQTDQETESSEEQSPIDQDTQIDEETGEAEQIEIEVIGETVVDQVSFRSEPSLEDQHILKELPIGTKIHQITAEEDEWYKVMIDEDEGWIHKDFVEIK